MDTTGTKIPPSPYSYKIIDGNGKVIGTGSGTSWGYRLPKPKGPQPSSEPMYPSGPCKGCGS